MRTVGLSLLLASLLGHPALAADKTNATDLTITSYLAPGLQYFRAASDSLAASGNPVSINIIEGQWFKNKLAISKPEVLKDVLSGKAVTTGVRHLTDEERAKGLREIVLGYYAAVVFAHPDAPVESIDTKKWASVIQTGKKFKWRDISSPEQKSITKKNQTKDPLDQQVTWSFPDASYADFARPFVNMGAISEALIKTFPKNGPDLTPIASTYVTAENKNSIGIFGYNLILGNQIHALKPVKVLKVNGVYPNERTIADNTYPFTQPVTLIYSAKAEENPKHSIHKIIAFLKTPPATAAAQQRGLIRAKF